ncbi:MAG: hypothetical protein AAF517_23795, partial [Planctomycetota bacterium]
PDERFLLSTGRDGTIRWWPVDPEDENRSITKAHDDARIVRWRRDGEVLASCGVQGEAAYCVRLWRAKTGELVREYALQPGKPLAFDWSANEEKFAVGGTGPATDVQIIDQASGVSTSLGDRYTNAVNSLRFSPDGSQLAVGVSTPQDFQVWNLEATPPKVLYTRSEFERRVDCIRYRPDGVLIAAASADGTVRIFQAKSGDPVTVYCSTAVAESLKDPPPKSTRVTFESTEAGPCMGVEWSADGRYLVWSCGRSIFIADTGQQEILRELKGHSTIIRSLDWGPDGTRLASGSDGGRIRMWAPFRGTASLSLDVGASVFGLDWSPDGRRLAAALRGGTVRILDAGDEFVRP